MGKINIYGKNFNKPLILDGKKYNKLTLKNGFGTNDGKVITFDFDWYAGTGYGSIYKNGNLIKDTPRFANVLIDKNGNWYSFSLFHKDVYKNGNVFKTFNSNIESFAIDKDANLYISTNDKKVYKNDNVLYALENNAENLAIDKDGILYFSSNTNVYKNNVLYLTATNKIRDIFIDINNNVYIGTGYGDGSTDNKIYKNGSIIKNLPNIVNKISVDESGNWYATTYLGGVYKNGDVINDMPSNCKDIYFDKNNNLFFTADSSVYKNKVKIKDMERGEDGVWSFTIESWGSRTGMWP